MPVPPVKNLSQILSADEPARTMRRNLLDMAMAGINAVMPENIIPSTVKRDEEQLKISGINGSIELNLSSFERILVTGAGKASAGLGRALAGIIGDRVSGGQINGTEDGEIGEVRLIKAGHPIPDEKGMEGAEEIRRIFTGAGRDDLVVFLLSGGASAMMPLPAKGITLEEKRMANDLLIRSGATIQEINCVRRHISAVKGGRLAANTKATVISLIISDVMGNQLESIGSGATSPDPTTSADAIGILRKYGLEEGMPASVLAALNTEEDTIKPGDARLSRVRNIIIADNSTAVKAMEAVATEKKCRFRVFYSITGDVDDMAERFAGECKPPGLCIGGGEMTAAVSGHGKGGRCQEFVLRLFMHGYRGIALAMGSDGMDGNSGAAGALFDMEAMKLVESRGLHMEEFLEKSDSYWLLSEAGTTIMTGYTGTNVGDIYLMLPFGTRTD